MMEAKGCEFFFRGGDGLLPDATETLGRTRVQQSSAELTTQVSLVSLTGADLASGRERGTKMERFWKVVCKDNEVRIWRDLGSREVLLYAMEDS